MTLPDSNSGSDGPRAAPVRGPRPCPICKKMSIVAYFPFCSKRCADVDLNRWLKQSYAIPAVEPPDGFGAGEDEIAASGEQGCESEPGSQP